MLQVITRPQDIGPEATARAIEAAQKVFDWHCLRPGYCAGQHQLWCSGWQQLDMLALRAWFQAEGAAWHAAGALHAKLAWRG